MQFTELDQWLSWLQTREIKCSPGDALSNVKTVAERLHLLPCIKPVITVTGTNGKGSCVALLEAIYHEAGYKVGTFTSPHLLHFNERICINKQMVSSESICEAFQIVNQARRGIELGYFQFAFLVALVIFRKQDLDLFILEVGIGGLYDAVNIIDANVSIISSIDLDHCELLGDTRELIAVQKAGIMRRGNTAVCGDLNPPMTIQQRAEQIGAVLYQQNKDFYYEIHANRWCFRSQQMVLDQLPFSSISLPNAATVLMAVACFNTTMPVDSSNIIFGLQNVYLRGRCEFVHFHGKKIILDVAHNPGAAKYLLQIIQSLDQVHRTYIVVGMLKDKDIAGTLKIFEHHDINHWFLTTLEGNRGTSAQYLSDLLEQIGIKNFSCYNQPSLAFSAACQRAGLNDLIVVFGSFRTVADILEHFVL